MRAMINGPRVPRTPQKVRLPPIGLSIGIAMQVLPTIVRVLVSVATIEGYDAT